MWGDEKFRTLSPALPSGQSLWIYLVTGPHTTTIPGLFEAGEAGLAEALGWPVEAFRQAFGEVVAQGMAEADFRGRVIFLPNAIIHNPPESPNVIISWKEAFDLIPECRLKYKALHRLRYYVQDLTEGFTKAFTEVFTQDLSQELVESGGGAGAGTGVVVTESGVPKRHAPPRAANGYHPSPTLEEADREGHPVRYILTCFDLAYRARFGERHPPFGDKEAALAKRICKHYGVDRAVAMVDAFFKLEDPWILNAGSTFAIFETQLGKVITSTGRSRDQYDKHPGPY